MFDIYDIDHSGDLDMIELTRMVKAVFSLNPPADAAAAGFADMDPDSFSKMLNLELDTDGDGNISRRVTPSLCAVHSLFPSLCRSKLFAALAMVSIRVRMRLSPRIYCRSSCLLADH